MKNYYRKQLLVALILLLASGSQKLFALQNDSLSFSAPIITEAVGSSPMTIQVSFVDTNTDEYGYYFDYGTDPEGPFHREDIYFGSRLDSGQVIVYNTNSGYEPNTTVYIKVAAFAYDDLTDTYSAPGPFSELVVATTLAGWPPSPSEFAATAEDAGIRLTWVDNSAPGHPLDEAYWLILRSNDGGNYNRSDTVPANTNFFVDTEVAPNTTYFYRLEAMNHFGHGYDVYGAVATALPVVDTPTVPASNISFSNVKPTSLSVSFTAGDGMRRLAVMKAGSAPGFRPANNYTYSGDLGDGQTVVFNGTASSFNLAYLQPDTEYFFKVFEFNTDGTSSSYLWQNAPLFSTRTGYHETSLQIYGMAFEGGESGVGTIFTANADGTNVRPLHSFNGADGANPYGSLLQTADGSIFGMTTQGGTTFYPHGVIFKIRPDGSDYTVVREFNTGTGDNPFGSLMQTADGFLVGTTYGGGAFGHGTIFKMKTDGSNYSVIHSFNQSEGFIPRCTLLQGPDGVLYGMTPWGGSSGFGTIFRINTDGTDFRILRNFSREIPQGSLIQATDGTLLGLTTEGGVNGVGVIFRVNPDGSDYATLFDFDNLNGRFPTGTLLLTEGNIIYGTTDAGGPYFENGAVQGGGTIFKINLDGTGHTVLHNFVAPTGSTPTGLRLILHENKLFGYTSAGGLHNGGVIFNYDLTTNTYNKLADLSNATGRSPAFGSLLLLNSVRPSDAVQNFSLVDMRTENRLLDFDDNISLDAGHPDFKYMTIGANADAEKVGSVLFRVNGKKINTENEIPYLLQSYSLRSLSEGEHTLVAEMYSKRTAKGVMLNSKNAAIHIGNNTVVEGFAIVDQNGVVIRALRDGDILSFEKSHFSNLNISAILNRTIPGSSVAFFLDDVPFRVANQAPYVMVSGKPKWWGTPGDYTVRATPHSRKNGKGVPGTGMVVNFTITAPQMQKAAIASARETTKVEDQGEGKKVISVYPVPTDHILNVLIAGYKDAGSAYVVIRNIYSHVVFRGQVSITSDRLTFDLDELGLTNGVYFLQVRTPTMNANMKFVKE